MADYTAQIKDIPELVADINARLADNNAGSISAQDVRETMRNVAKSIRHIVASGQWEDAELRFVNNIHVKTTTDLASSLTTGGIVIVESGIRFDNEIGNGALQTHPYPGPGAINHAELTNLSQDVHPQYLPLNGSRAMQADLKIDQYSISSSGYAGHGISFEHGGADRETLVVGNETDIKFAYDNTRMTTGRSTAQAWLSFSSVSGVVGESDNVTVHASYNITKIERLRDSNNVLENGKFKIYFKQNLFADGEDYIAIGRSNGRDAHSEGSDFDRVDVAVVERAAEYCTFYVLDETGNYTDAYWNDLVVFGVPSGTLNVEPSVLVKYQAVP